MQSVRFADSNDGWVTTIYVVWATHDGGAHWEQPRFPGIQPGNSVSDLEASAGVVHVAFTGPHIEIETSPVNTDNWTLSPTAVPVGAGPVPDEQIVLQRRVGWLIEVDRVVVGGARLDNGVWVPWNPPCTGGPAIVGPAVIAVSDPTHLVAVCDEGVYSAAPQLARIYFSDDGGTTFQLASSSLPQDSFGPIASPAPGVVLIGGSRGDLMGTFDGGVTWKVVYHQSTPVAWGYVGFTSPRQGVAIEEPGALLMTFDGGHKWAPVHFPPVQS